MPNPIKTVLDSALKIAKDPATKPKIKTGLKDGAAWFGNRAHPAVIRLSRGKLGTKVGAAPVLLLTTTGRKSGKARTVPLCYLAEGDDLVIVASYGGDDRAPQWFGNLQADPAVTVEIDGTTTPMTATVADADAKARLWPQVVAMYKGYAGYQKKTDRDIPLVLLTPKPAP
jgi:deazaflavin-dependent oxidoreductase (nitroreductase family)